MCRSNQDGQARECPGHKKRSSSSSAARVQRRRRQKARARLDAAASGERVLTEYEQMLARGALIYWHSGRLSCDSAAEADRAYARRRHELFLRSLGLDETGADASIRAERARRLHEASDDDPSRAWVQAAIEDQANVDAWEATGASIDDLYERTARGFGDEHPDDDAVAGATFTLGAVASEMQPA